jgi:thiol-disulfide isomerase/thioredoxin
MTNAETRITNGRAPFDFIRGLSFWLCLFSSQWLAAVGAAAREAEPALPQYRLAVGQELVYELTAVEDPRESKDAARDQMQWRVVVGRQNNDGSWRLYIRTKVMLVNADGSPRHKQDSLGYCDLRPDGSYKLDEQTAVFKKLFPYQLFCRLPGTATALATGWTYEPPVYQRAFSYKQVKRDGDHLHVAATQSDIYSEVHQWQTSYAYDFDVRRGLVERIVNEWKDLGTGQVKKRQTVRLISSANRDAAWIARFHGAAERYLSRHKEWMTLCYEALRARTVDECKSARVKARSQLVAGREQVEVDAIRELYDADLRTHDADEEWMTKSAMNRARFLAAAAEFPADWQAKTLDGGEFRLTDQRGKIVVLFFWGTGCEYCVLSVPQIRQLATDYRNHNVAVVGMFLAQEAAGDDHATAGQFIQKCYQGFPHLDAKAISSLYRLEQYGLEGSPSILILDQAGKVRDVHLGYAADLGQHIRKVVGGLLIVPAIPK